MEDRRTSERKPSQLPVRVTADRRTWTGTCINLSDEGALLRLDTPWDGGGTLRLGIDPILFPSLPDTEARVIRVSNPTTGGAFLAVRFPLGALI